MPFQTTKKKTSRTSQKKQKKQTKQKTTRRHRASTVGKVTLPLDVKSEKDLPALKKLLDKKPLTIILVYATWCPHCHTIMPHFDAAAKNPQNTVSSLKLRETMVPSAYDYIKKNVNRNAAPIQVDGYPSILLVNQKAEKVADVETKQDTAYLSKVMRESGNLAEQAGLSLSSIAPPATSLKLNEGAVQRKAKAENVVEDVVENEIVSPSMDVGETAMNSMNLYRGNKSVKNVPTLASIPASAKAPSPQPAITANSIRNIGASKANNLTPSKEMEKKADALFSLETPVEPIQAPSMGDDIDNDVIISNTLSPEQKVGGGRGGSLIQAMTRATYTLAPAAALLATAVMVGKTSKKGAYTKQKSQKTQKKQKKSVKRRK